MPDLIFCDTEYTTWPGAADTGWAEDWQHRELVQIAALRVDAATLRIKDSFDCLVKPVINPRLSPFFTELTAITQQQLDAEGHAVADAFAAFKGWIAGTGGDAPIISYGDDNIVFIETAGLNGLAPPFDGAFNNCRDLVAMIGLNPSHYSSGTLYRAAGLCLDGHVHNALHDCTSMAAALSVWVKLYPALRTRLNDMAAARQLLAA